MPIKLIARVLACFIAAAPLAARAACPPGGDALASALCEPEAADGAAADFAKAFTMAMKAAQPSTQAAILRAQAASKLRLNQTCTFARGAAIFVSFGCAREMIQRRTAALQGVPYDSHADPRSLGIHFFLVSHYNCAGAKTNFSAASCAAANASADLYAHRQLLAQYGLTMSIDQQAALTAQDQGWKRNVAYSCGAARGRERFFDFDCVDRAVVARDAALSAAMEAPALNPRDNGVFAVRATAMPWFWHAGFNDAYPFGPLGGTGPTIVSLPALGATPGRRIAVEYQSGVIAGSDGKLDTDANGFGSLVPVASAMAGRRPGSASRRPFARSPTRPAGWRRRPFCSVTAPL